MWFEDKIKHMDYLATNQCYEQIILIDSGIL